MKRKRIGLLILLAGLLIVPAISRAQGQREAVISLTGNTTGDSVLVTLVDEHTVWVTETPRDSATSYDARDTVCAVDRATVTVCGHFVYVAVSCADWPPQVFVFETRQAFPCAQPTTVYIPLIQN